MYKTTQKIPTGFFRNCKSMTYVATICLPQRISWFLIVQDQNELIFISTSHRLAQSSKFVGPPFRSGIQVSHKHFNEVYHFWHNTRVYFNRYNIVAGILWQWHLQLLVEEESYMRLYWVREGYSVGYSSKIFAVLKCQLLFALHCIAVRFVGMPSFRKLLCWSDFQM